MKKTFVILASCLLLLSQNILAIKVNNHVYKDSINIEVLGVDPGTGGYYKEVKVTVYRSVTDTYENRYYYNDGEYSGYISIDTVNKIRNYGTEEYILEIVYKGIVYRNS